MENNYELLVQQEMTDAEVMLASANAEIIKTPADAQRIASLRKDIKLKYKLIEDKRKSQTGPLDLTKKRIMDFFRKPLDLLDQTDRILGAKWLAYDQAVREAAAAEQRRINAEAAERERKEKEKLAKQAEKAEASGKAEKAEELRQRAEEYVAPPPAIVAPPPRAEGSGIQTRWEAEVTDIRALCLAVAEGRTPAENILPNQKALNQQAVALKSGLSIPGVRAISREIAVSR
jgi:hypothetical protein